MFEKSVRLFELFGFEVKIDPTWLIIAVLITWSLASGLFPTFYEGLEPGVYWWMGLAGALGLFVSIVFHELWHSLIARRFGLPMRGITLFIFGGIAEMNEEPPSAKAEFFMAIAGPLSSIVLGFIFLGVASLSRILAWPLPVSAVFDYLKFINWLLAGFNLVPAFPLDGGRVLRSALWKWKDNLAWATRISSEIGSGFGLLLAFIGILNIIGGAIIGGIWWLLIGLFLRNASQMSYQRLVIRQTLEGEPVKRFMRERPSAVSSSTTILDLVENYIYKYHYKLFPVVDNGRLLGCVRTKEVKDIPKEEWGRHKVGEVLKPCKSNINTLSPDTDATQALAIMNKTGNTRLLVSENSHLLGIITLKDLLRFFSMKMDLEGRNPVGLSDREIRDQVADDE